MVIERSEKEMRVCDSCNREITDNDDSYCIIVESRDSKVEYDCCSTSCGAKVFHQLSEQWNKESSDQR